MGECNPFGNVRPNAYPVYNSAQLSTQGCGPANFSVGADKALRVNISNSHRNQNEPDVLGLMQRCYEQNGNKVCALLDTLVTKLAENFVETHHSHKLHTAKDRKKYTEAIKNRILHLVTGNTESTEVRGTQESAGKGDPARGGLNVVRRTVSREDSEGSKSKVDAEDDDVVSLSGDEAEENEESDNGFIAKLNKVELPSGDIEKLKKREELLNARRGNKEIWPNNTNSGNIQNLGNTLEEFEKKVDSRVAKVAGVKASIIGGIRKADLLNRNRIATEQSGIEWGERRKKNIAARSPNDKQSDQSVSDDHDKNEGGFDKKTGRGNIYVGIKSELNLANLTHIREHLTLEMPNLPTDVDAELSVDELNLNAFAEKLFALKNKAQKQIADNKKELEGGESENLTDRRKDELDQQSEACECSIELAKGFQAKILELRETISAANRDIDYIEALDKKFKNTSNEKVHAPFSLPLLANGQQPDPTENYFSLGNAFFRNFTRSRAARLKNVTNMFTVAFNNYETVGPNKSNRNWRQSDAANRNSLAMSLGGTDPGRRENVFQFLGDLTTNVKKEGLGRALMYDLAACNVVCAGFNQETLKLESPSLAYKVGLGYEGSSWLKRRLPTAGGAQARNPEKFTGNRLEFVSALSSKLQAEVFREGVSFGTDAPGDPVITAHHAIEASSLILAALPNDLLTRNGAEVTKFMQQVKTFEETVYKAQAKNKPIDTKSAELKNFKETLNSFHKAAATWVSSRDAEGAEQSIKEAKLISKSLAPIPRKGFFRLASVVALGNRLNLCGGVGIRKWVSQVREAVATANQPERLRQKLVNTKGHPNPILFDVRIMLNNLLEDENSKETPNEDNVKNAEALIEYLEGKGGQSVKLPAPLSKDIGARLLKVGEDLQKIWEPISNEKPAPKVIVLSDSQVGSIPEYAGSRLSEFVEGGSSLPVKEAEQAEENQSKKSRDTSQQHQPEVISTNKPLPKLKTD